jgi:hypothetical protein
MPTTLTNMNLTAWDSPTDTFDYAVLAQNFKNIDKHDHGANGGAKIAKAALDANSVDNSKIVQGSIDANYALKDRSITRIKIKQGIVPDLVSVLPRKSTIEAGYEVYYQNTDMASSTSFSSSNIVWHLRYDGLNAWQFIGGSPITKHQEAAVYYLQNNRGAVATPSYEAITGMSVTVPPGKYYVTGTGRGSLTYSGDPSGASSGMYFAIDTAAPTNDNRATSFAPPYIASQTNLGTSMTVVNNVNATSSKTSIKLWLDGFNANTTTSKSSIKVCSIAATPIYLTAT